LRAISCARWIFSGVRGHHEPDATVLSFAMITHQRLATRAKQVTTPAPGDVSFSSPVPNVSPWFTNVPTSKVRLPASMSRSTRSRAVSLPFLCTRSTYLGPQPAWTSRRRAESVSSRDESARTCSS
jgi:hypothetical protein